MKKPRLRTVIITLVVIVQIALVAPVIWFIHHLTAQRKFTSATAEPLVTHLSTGDFKVLYYKAEHPRGILIVATGDGGWSDQWEEPVAIHASAAGYAVGGWDCRVFADSRKFNQDQLVEAFNAAVTAVRTKANLPADTPVWYTGWSTGAEWALAAAASPKREKNLVGILPAAPGTHSRYGITESDLLGAEPSGEGSFTLADLAPHLSGVSVVQFAGELDPLDDDSCTKALTASSPHKIIVIPGAPHDMDGAGPRFLSELDQAMQWQLDQRTTTAK